MTDPSTSPAADLILFDGDCSVCNRWVQFVLQRDPRGRFHFASLQSAAGRAVLARVAPGQEIPDSIVLVRGERIWFFAGAVLRIAAGLRGPWPLLAALLIVPAPLRDWCYRVFAARRHRWFGKVEHCLVPSPEQRDRFLDLDERQ